MFYKTCKANWDRGGLFAITAAEIQSLMPYCQLRQPLSNMGADASLKKRSLRRMEPSRWRKVERDSYLGTPPMELNQLLFDNVVVA